MESIGHRLHGRSRFPLECQERCDGGWWGGDTHRGLTPETRELLSHELRANAGTNARSALDQSTIPNRRPLWEGEDDISIRWTSRLADEKSLFPARPDTASGLPTLQEQNLSGSKPTIRRHGLNLPT